jgi:hypothetical protein
MNEYKIYSNMAAYGTDTMEKWNQALYEVIQYSRIHQ